MINVKTVGAAALGAVAIGLGVSSVNVAPAQAVSFLNQTVQADVLFPDTNTVIESLGSQVIGPGGATFSSSAALVDAFVTSTNITFTNRTDNSFISADFAGFRFLDALGTISPITGVTLASSNFPGFDASRITFDSDRIFVNFQGLPTVAVGDTISLDVQFASANIPTPALLPGLIGMGVAAIRKKRHEQSEQVAETAEV